MKVVNKYTWVLVLGLFALLSIQTCRLNRISGDSKEAITQSELDKQSLKVLINSQKDTILAQRAIVSSSQKAISDYVDTIFSLKRKDAKNLKTLAYYKGITKTVLSEVRVPYLDSSGMKKFSDSVEAQCQEVITYMRDSTITVPRTAEVVTQDFDLSATIKKEVLIVDKLIIPDTLNLRFVEHKAKLFKSSFIEAQFFHSNPLIQTTGSNSVVYKPKKKSFFKTVILPVSAGIVAGLILAK